MTAPAILDAAIWYAGHGLKVFPCREDKSPATEHGHLDATADVERVRALWQQSPNALIGLPAESNGLLVVDCDPRNGGPASRGEFIETFGPLPETAEVLTGGGGRHFYFRHPGGKVPGTLGAGVDLKSSGYVIAPPSVHPSGRRYEFDGVDGAKAILSPADPPAWLLARVQNGRRAQADPSPDGPIPRGNRNAHLASLAGSMRRRGMAVASILAALLEENSHHCNPPLEDSEVQRIAESVGRYVPAQERTEKSGPAEDQTQHLIQRIEDLPTIATVTARPIEWVIGGILPASSIVMLSGKPGHFKSTVASALVGHSTSGAPFCGRAVQRREALVIDKENPAPVVLDRLQRLGMTDGYGLYWWGGWNAEEPPHPGGAVILDWIARTTPKPILVVDSLVAFLNADENSSTEVRAFMHTLRRIAQTGATVILVHHSGKSDTAADYRGSSDIEASVDVAYHVSNVGDPARLERVKLRAFKARVMVEPEMVFEFDERESIWAESNSRGVATNSELFAKILSENPGIGSVEFERIAVERRLGRDRARQWLESSKAAGTVRTERGVCNQKRFFLGVEK
ncbi:MAG: bifunctional DNA primase/polymerase [Acidobacteria bacterium]|nr:bifunctional DNA primase/polymerase [Acidobacteriota bacterium]